MQTEYVLDASAAGKLLRREDHSPAMDAFVGAAVAGGARFIVPPVFAFELRNLASKTLAEGLFTDLKAARSEWETVMQLVDERPVSPAEDLEMAHSKGLNIYDAAYVVLAGPGRPLVTYDKRQAAASPHALSPR